MKILLSIILAVFAFGANAETWKYKSSRLNSLVGNNYIDFTKHNGKIYYSTNSHYRKYYSGGKLWIQSSDTLTSRPGNAWNPIAKSELAQYTDIWGQPMDYVRSTGIESYGGRCYLLMHVGAQYGSGSYYYAPAFADSDDCVNWTYHGPVNVDGIYAPYIFSSSSAYFIEDGVHYMAQDAGSYGDGRLVIYSSPDGLNYTQYSGDVNYFPADRPVFPDMDSCGGIYHMLYEEAWQSSYPLTEKIRHMTSIDILNWEMHDDDIGIRDYKGMNISCIDNELYGIRYRRLYKWE